MTCPQDYSNSHSVPNLNQDDNSKKLKLTKIAFKKKRRSRVNKKIELLKEQEFTFPDSLLNPEPIQDQLQDVYDADTEPESSDTDIDTDVEYCSIIIKT
ncbi:hypothetical protein Hokovirus_1_104 [Hokovirus HKV1]|uniref:Uncharacterized protein n=1 Tax=Hokovirus HKV1 TaxID=1977638 RepID=A0A1V0SES5_9VIRU|nr:hypothetical protein Hokovirus_1_104 [Hokovirus HKV1]